MFRVLNIDTPGVVIQQDDRVEVAGPGFRLFVVHVYEQD